MLVRDLRRPNAEIRAGDRDEFEIDRVVQRDLFHAAFFVGRRAFVDGEGRLGTQRAGETRARAYAMPMSVDNVVGVTDDHVAAVCSNGLYYLVTLP